MSASEEFVRETRLRKNPSPDSPDAGAPFWAVALLVLAVIGVYTNSFSGPFFFDDFRAIQTNPSIRHLWPPWAPLLPPEDLTVGGRPVLNLSFAFNYAISGFNVWSYHAFNLLIHILAGLTLLGVVHRTLQRPILRERFGADATWLALAIALLWALHPLQTESVTYISQRAESLMGLFYLLTLYAFIRATGSTPHRRRWLVISVVSCFLGMATKEVMVTAPLIVLIYDRTFLAGSFREAWQRHSRFYLALAATWIMPAYALIDIGKRAVGFGHGVTPWSYALTECGVIVDYLKLIFWPHPLVIDYGLEMVREPWQVLPQGLILLVLLAITAIAFVRRTSLGFTSAWFFIILAVTSSVIPIVASPMSEHRLYLPLAAPITLGVLGIYSWLGRSGLIVAMVLAVGCSALTFERNEDYRSEVVLWEQAISLHPTNARALNNLGYVLLQQGRVAEAIAQCQKALAIDPSFSEVHNNLGNAFLQNGQMDEAMTQYKQALAANLNFVEAHYNLGNVLLQKGQVDDAITQYEATLAIDPDDPAVHNNLGKAFVLKGRMDEAMAQFQIAINIDSSDAEAHNNLGNVLRQKGRLDEAIAEYQKALRLNPHFGAAQQNLDKAQALSPPTTDPK